jgi:hypothetical protein
LPRSTRPLSNACTTLLGPAQAFLVCGAKACNNQPILLNPGCSIPCQWDTLACSSSCEQSPTHLNTHCVHHLRVHPGPTWAATLLPPCSTTRQLKTPPPRAHSLQSILPLHSPTPHSWARTSIHCPWGLHMQQSTNSAELCLLYPMSMGPLSYTGAPLFSHCTESAPCNPPHYGSHIHATCLLRHCRTGFHHFLTNHCQQHLLVPRPPLGHPQ